MAHWIGPNFKLYDCLLAFIPLHGSHTGVNLASYVETTLEKFNLTQKLFCITTDSASNNKTMMESLCETLREKYNVEIDPEDRRIPCLAHVINLAVGAFLKTLKVIDDNGMDAIYHDDEEALRNHLENGTTKDFALKMLKIHHIVKFCICNT